MANEDNYIVYKHTSPSGKVYIGITKTTIEKRSGTNGRNYKKNTLFFRAIAKYGWQNITHEILYSGFTKHDACKKETELISEYKSNNPSYGYNLSVGGESGNAGVIASDETRKKMSISHLGNPSNTGKRLSMETRKKLSDVHKGNTVMRGRKLSDETRKKMSEAQKGEKNHFYGKSHSAETRQKIATQCLERDMRDGNNPKARKVCQLTLGGDVVKTWDSIKSASAFLGISYSYLMRIMQKQKEYKGFVWAYGKAVNGNG